MKNNQLKPKDIFNQAVEIIYSKLEPLGWKRLKNGDIKKKNGNLTYRIFFFRSYKNYIHYPEMKGSVTTEIYCNIDIAQREAIYQLRFANEFELLTKDCQLNSLLIENVCKIINYEYINIIKGLEENPRQQLLKMPLMEESYAYDYSYETIMRKELLELFGFDDLLKLYNENNSFYNSPQNRAYISQEHYFYTLNEGFDPTVCNELSDKELVCLVQDVYNFIKKTNIYDDYIEAQYQHLKKIPQTNKFKWVITVFWFVYPNLIRNFENNKSAKKLVRKVLEFHNTIKIKKAYC